MKRELPGPRGGAARAKAEEPDERKLVDAARGGDVDAFERLYRLKVGKVYAICLRMSGAPEEAEELTQDTFVRAWRALPSFRGASSFSTWLTRIAANLALSERRKDGPREEKAAEREDMDALAEQREPASPESAMDLEKAIAALPRQARQVFVLHDIEGWKHAEIARSTGIAVGTCKAHLHRARELLKGALSI